MTSEQRRQMIREKVATGVCPLPGEGFEVVPEEDARLPAGFPCSLCWAQPDSLDKAQPHWFRHRSSGMALRLCAACREEWTKL